MPKNYLKPIAPRIHVDLEEQGFSLTAGGTEKVAQIPSKRACGSLTCDH